MNCCTGPRAITPIVSPTAKLDLLAVFASIATSFGPLGQRPETSSSGLKRWSPFGCTPNASGGAPWPETTLPSCPTR